MNTAYRIVLILLCIAGAGNWAGAVVIKGKVTDKAGNILPYSTIFVEGTTIGTNANAVGYYELDLPEGLYKINCRLVGYKEAHQNVDCRAGNAPLLPFVLESEYIERKDATVYANGEDPAYNIIRKAIAQRPGHLDQTNSFTASVYMKGVFRTRAMPGKVMGKKVDKGDLTEMGLDTAGKGVLFLVEEDADYYKRNKDEKYVIRSVRQSGIPGSVGFSSFPPVINYYKNSMDVLSQSPRGFISPIADNALFYYRYKYLGQFMEQGHIVNKIEVKPRRGNENCFTGTIYIAESDYYIHSLELTLTKNSGIDQFDTLTIKQVYLPNNTDQYAIKSQVIYCTLKFFGIDITGNIVTVYNKPTLNATIADSVFAGKAETTYLADANKKDTSYFSSNRPIPLASDEIRDYQLQDSLRLVRTNPHRLDSLRRKQNKFKITKPFLGGYTYRSDTPYFSFYLGLNLLGVNNDNLLNYNTTEGLNINAKLGFTYYHDSFSRTDVQTVERYGLANTHFNTIGSITHTIRNRKWRGRYSLVGIDAGKYVFQYNGNNPVIPSQNTWTALYEHYDELRLYEREELSLLGKIDRGNGFTALGRLSYQNRIPLQKSTDYSFVNDGKPPFVENITADMAKQATLLGYHHALLFQVRLTYQPGVHYIQYPDFKRPVPSSAPTFLVCYQKGITDILQSSVNYDRWKAGIYDAVLEVGRLGAIGYHCSVGGFINREQVGIPDLQQIIGNRGWGYATPYLTGFQMAPFYADVNTAPFYGEAHVEYHLNGFLTNKLPLFNKLHWHLVAGTNLFYLDNDVRYYEQFIGIENIGYKLLRLGRIDFIQSIRKNEPSLFGVRFSLTNLSQNGLTDNHLGREW